jgi:methyl-accepting chemotaxis protein
MELANYSIRLRAIAAFGSLLFLILGLAGVGWTLMGSLQANVNDMGGNWLLATRYLGEMKYYQTYVRANAGVNLVRAKTPAEIDNALKLIATYQAKFDESARNYEATIDTPEEKALYEQSTQALKAYWIKVDTVIEMAKDGQGFFAGDRLAQARTEFDQRVAAIDKDIGFNNDGAANAMKAAASTYTTAQMIVLAVTGFAMVIGTASFLMVLRTISDPISKMSHVMEDLAANDLSAEIPGLQRQDEIGHMARAVQIFKDNAHAKLKADHAQAEAQKAQARLKAELAANEQREREAQAQRSKAVEGLISGFERDSRAALENLDRAAGQMRQVGTDLTQIVGQSTRATSDVANAAGLASQNVQTVSAATEQMVASIKEIANQVNFSAGSTHEAVSTSEKASSEILELAKAADRIGQIVSLISDVASKTDLLALNATIEAARAGDAGKGFAVVASEVKQLASQTAKATDEISAQIHAVQEATKRAVQTIGSVANTIGVVNQTVTAIAAAVEEQTAAAAEISRNTQDASNGTSQVTERISEVAKMAQQSGKAADNVARSSDSINDVAIHLKSDISRFLSAVRAV